MSLDGFSMYPLARELHAALAGGRIDRVFQPSKHAILLAVRQPGQNLTVHISINPQNPAMNLIEHSLANPTAPPLFCMVLRKQIEDGRIAAVEQSGLDRILTLQIDTLGAGGRIATKALTVELMGKYSNIILQQEGRIIDALRKVGSNENRVRQILPGRDYLPPPKQDKCDLFTVSAAAWIEELQKYPALPIAKAVVQASLGLGPVSAREIVWRAGLPGERRIETLDDADFQSLAAAAREICAAYRDRTNTPTAVIGENQKLLAISAFRLDHLHAHTARVFATMSELLDFAGKKVGSYTPPDKDRFRKLAANELAKAKNKRGNLQEELEQAHNAEEYKAKGDILMTYQYRLTDGYINAVELPDIYSEAPEEQTVRITLDPQLTPAQNMQKYYQKYNKLKRAQESLRIQLRQCENDIRYLSSIESSLDSCTAQPEIDEIKAELISAGYLTASAKRKTPEKPSQPYKFVFEDTTILVGKNNYQNDRLTFKTAQAADLWLHAKDIPGSHVIIRCENRPPSPALIRRAAELAGYFSKARDSSNIPVDCAQRRHVKKPSGAKPGFVIYTDQQTLYVTPDRAVIEAELAQQ